MSIIGDLIFLLRGDPKQLNVDVQKAGDKAGQTFGQRMSAGFKKSWSGAEIGKGLVQGLGLAGGLGAARLFAGAISKVGDVLGDMTKAAIADEESVNRLAASLKANVPNWNGNTDAIEKNILAKQRLGFEDEALRDSLTVLVGATHDVTKAQEIQNVAMDLARFKGIDLKTASEALIKVEGGVFRSLKQLGIKLKDNATSTEALAAVQKVAAGQAEAYADTNAGKLLASQIKVDEAMENLGKRTMPLVVDATVAAADAVTVLAGGFDVLSGKMPKTADEAHEATDALRGMSDALGTLFPNLRLLGAAADEVDKGVDKSFSNASAAASSFEQRVAESMGGAGVSMDTLADTSGDMARDIKKDNRTVMQSWEDLKESLKQNVDDLISDAFDPLIAKNQLAASNAEAAAARRVVASATASNAEKRDAKDTLDSVAKDTASLLTELAETGMTGSKAFKTGLKSLETYATTTSGETRKQLDKVIAKIKELERVGKQVPINIVVRGGVIQDFSTGHGGPKAEGGSVQANVPYLVGERGPEIVVPRVSGTVLSNAQSMPLLATGTDGGGSTYNVNLLDRLEIRTPRDISDGLRMLESRGYLNLRRKGRR